MFAIVLLQYFEIDGLDMAPVVNNPCMKVQKLKFLKLVLCLCGCCLLLCFAFSNTSYSYISFFDLFKNASCEKVCLVGTSGDFSSTMLSRSTNTIQTGGKSFVYFDSIDFCEDIGDADYLQLQLNQNKNEVLDYLSNFGAQLVCEECVDKKQIFYLYLPMLCKYKFVDGKKVNIQLVVENNSCLVGHPMIYTAY